MVGCCIVRGASREFGLDAASRCAVKYIFETDCTCSNYEDIRALIETLQPVSLLTVYKNVVGLAAWARSVGYDSAFGARGLSLERDWHVGTYRGVYRGRSALVVRWSGIEHIWTRP